MAAYASAEICPTYLIVGTLTYLFTYPDNSKNTASTSQHGLKL